MERLGSDTPQHAQVIEREVAGVRVVADPREIKEITSTQIPEGHVLIIFPDYKGEPNASLMQEVSRALNSS